MTQPQRVVIIGGGFGGLSAAQNLKNVPVQVSLIDQRNFHLFQPLLYQVATGWLSPANIASTLRATLKHQRNASVFLGQVEDIDFERCRVTLSDCGIEYDILIVATGSRPFYFGNERWRQNAPGLKTIEDAIEIRRRIFMAFEAAERGCGPTELDALLTFAIVGGGPTGVELAGALGEIAHDMLAHDFRKIDPSKTRILLLEGGDRILPTYAPELSVKATVSLEKLGVTVWVNALVSEIGTETLTVKRGQDFEHIPCRTVIWAAGVQASPLGCAIAAGTGAKIDRAGRVTVEPDLTVAGHPEIFVIGDLASYIHQTGELLPGVAPVAIQQGRYAARVIAARINAAPIEPFHYRDRGNMAIVGHASAVAEIGRLRFSGYLAWLAWLFVHLVNLIEFENKVLVLIQWGWYYFSRNRAARLITGEKTFDEVQQRAAGKQNNSQPLSRAD